MKTLKNLILSTSIILLASHSSIKAQDFQTQLEQATKDLANPIYAIIEIPQPDGTTQYISIKKNEREKISQLETNYQWSKDEILAIDKAIFYKKIKNSEEEYIQVVLEENCNLDTNLVMIAPPMTKTVEIPVGGRNIFKRTKITKTVTIPAQYDTITELVLIKPESTGIVGAKEVTIPAEYKTVNKILLLAPEKTKEITEYVIELEKLIYRPNIIKTLNVPAEYKTKIQHSIKDSTKVIQLEIPTDYKSEANNTARIQTTDIIKYYRPKSTNISIFPNPATDKINIQSEDNIEQITIFDTQGRVVFSDFYKNEKTAQIEISDFNNGFYSIQVKTNVTLQTSKILKQ